MYATFETAGIHTRMSPYVHIDIVVDRVGEPREFPGRRIYNADRACEKSMGVGAIMEMDLPSNKARGTGTGTRGAGQG